MWVGWIEFDLLLGDVHSLKEKRAIVRPIVSELRRRFAVSAAETGALDLHRRSGIGSSLVASDRAHIVDVLDSLERWMAERPEVETLGVQRSIRASTDE